MKSVDFPVSFFVKNRERICHLLKPGSLAIFHANDEMNRSADQKYPYRQDSDLFYLTGINQEKTVLLLSPDYPDESLREILFILRPDKKLETWEGHKLSLHEAQMISGIKTIKYLGDFDSLLAALMQHNNNIYLNLYEPAKAIPEFPNRNLRMAKDLQAKFPAHHYERLAPVMCNLRTIKSDTEILIIQEACAITGQAFRSVLNTIRPGVYEYEIEAELTYEFIRNGARGHAFDPIVASGANACSLHYNTNNACCSDGDLLLLDFGAEYGNYAADCSRTIPVNGVYTPRQKELYQSVLEVFRFACSLMRPGTTINKIHAEVCRKFSQEHVKLGLYAQEDLMKEDKDAPLYMQYYMHGTSHFMGIDVHDIGGKDIELRPGMILTCEPGIYIPAEKTGIRIENDILITSNGCMDLMKDIPIEADHIEQLIALGKR